MAFKVGQKIVCVDDSGAVPCIKKDTIYTVSFYTNQWCCSSISVSLMEVPGTLPCRCNACGRRFYGLIGFKPSRFRPLDELLSEQSDFDLWKIEQEIERDQLVPVER